MWTMIVFILVCEAGGLVSSVFTFPSIPTWYRTLHKPFFSPPNWVFGPVWTMLYALMGISLYLVWQKGIKKKKVKDAILIFTLQLILNFLWSVIFFGLHSIVLAFVEIVFLWIAILMTIVKFKKVDITASLFLWPYLIWVSFASLLNFYLLLLN